MPDSPDKPTAPTPGGKRRELPMEVRMLIAFVLMGLVLYLTPYFYKPPAQPKPAAPPAAEQAKKPGAAAEPAAPAAAAPKPAEATPAVAGDRVASSEQTYAIDTNYYHIVFSNRGGVVLSWMLKKYKDSAGKPLELVDTSTVGLVPAPFSLIFPGGTPKPDPNTALFVATPAPNGLGIEFEYSSGGVAVRKSFRFEVNSYLSHFTSEVTGNGKPAPHLIAWRGGFGDAQVVNAAAVEHSLYYDTAAGKLRVKVGKDAKNGPVSAKGDFTFAGLEDSYFAAVFLPADNTSIELDSYGDNLPRGTEKKMEPHVGMAVGGDSLNRFTLFVGPKDVDLLNTVDPKLKQLIDWGWFGIIAKPLFLVMKLLNNHYIHNWGWSIIIITILMNLAVLPLRFSSMKSAKKMQALQPQIQAINAKYKNVKLNDPRNAEKNQEVMDLYKKHGVNPVGGCVPMLLQLPLLYAFYKVLGVTIELRHAPWLWVGDLSQPEHLAIRILPTVMIITQFLVQKLTPNPTTDPSQAKIMMFTPLLLGFFFYYQSSGLVLYWLTSNLVGIVTQWMMNRSSAPVTVAPPPQQQPRKKLSKA